LVINLLGRKRLKPLMWVELVCFNPMAKAIG